uniref:8.1 kDa putative secretory protein n=1 Tax=Argas monolakensis TaxID=34602 RepID=Q09JX5_ARGMO|nr:8.1 kDa putative secretory protein [Argas monolakensis]
MRFFLVTIFVATIFCLLGPLATSAPAEDGQDTLQERAENPLLSNLPFGNLFMKWLDMMKSFLPMNIGNQQKS